MKNKKTIALILCAALLTGTIAATIQASGSNSSANDSQTTITETATEEKIPLFLEKQTSDTTVKDESVYVLAQTDGSVRKIIVSDWLRNGTNAGTITDQSELTLIIIFIYFSGEHYFLR